jgi:hypothetical protein
VNLPPEVKQQLMAAPFESVTALWQILEESLGAEGKRWLSQNDRYYLLVRTLKASYAIHPWIYARCREVEQAPDGYLDLWAREHFKALALDTPVLTPTGYRPHGELSVGDWVYGSDGAPTAVVATTPVYTDAECYSVRFDDATEITCSAQHLWTVQVPDRRRVPGTDTRRGWKTITVDTATLQQYQCDAKVPVAPAFFTVPAMLPIAPYTLGAWLGDGANACGRITCGDLEIYDRVREDGYTHMPLRPELACQNATIYGLTALLRSAGLLHNKHIPRHYLQGSVEQRRAVLQGLMDTDGTCNDRGTCIFVNKHRPLAESTLELCVGLGLKPTLNTFGEPGDEVFYVTFQGYAVDAPFCLPRKLAKCKTGARQGSAFRRVWEVKRVQTVPVSCIQVSNKDGLYLCGSTCVTTHNSTVITYAGAIQAILQNPNVTIGIFSHTKPIAKGFLRQIQKEFESNEEMRALFPEICWENCTRDAPSWSLDNGITLQRSSNSREATVEAHGLVDGQPTSRHFSLLIYDDVVTRESVSTPEQISKTTEAWGLSDNLGAVGGRKWHVGTRYSYADTYEEMIKRGAVKVRLYAATLDGTIDGDPVLFDQETWDAKVLAQGEATIACQMLQNPLAGQQRMFNIEDIREYEVRPEILNCYIMVDPARSKKKDSAKTAIAVIGVDYAMNKYLLDGFNHQMDLRERWVRTAQMYHKWKRTQGIQSVKVGYEAFGATADLDYFEEQMGKPNEGGFFAIEELMWPRDGEGSKVDRVQRLGPDLRARKLYVPYDTDPKNLTNLQRRLENTGYKYRIAQPIRRKDGSNKIYDLSKDLKNQIHFFPFGGKKDLIDAASRIYDMEPKSPNFNEPSYLEPEWT